jgi:hypothetical protein
MRLAHKSVFLPETRTGLVVDQGGMWILVSRGDVNVSLARESQQKLLSQCCAPPVGVFMFNSICAMTRRSAFIAALYPNPDSTAAETIEPEYPDAAARAADPPSSRDTPLHALS